MPGIRKKAFNGGKRCGPLSGGAENLRIHGSNRLYDYGVTGKVSVKK